MFVLRLHPNRMVGGRGLNCGGSALLPTGPEDTSIFNAVPDSDSEPEHRISELDVPATAAPHADALL